jgi:hypothetical protein
MSSLQLTQNIKMTSVRYELWYRHIETKKNLVIRIVLKALSQL